jgi:hypothetical protein
MRIMKERRSPVVVGLSKKPKVVRWSSGKRDGA